MSNEPSAQASLVSEKTAFSWPVVVVLSTCLLVVGGLIAKIENIGKDADMLRARVDLLDHQQSADRGQLNAQAATLGELKALVIEVRTDVRELSRGPASKR
jgi:outer membrane murein-binding lipoprotein Lpp